MTRADTRRSGMTLVELLVVMAILGVLAAISVPVMRSPTHSPARFTAAGLRAHAVQAGASLTRTDSLAWGVAAYATPDGVVFTNSGARVSPFNGEPRDADRK